MIPFWFLMSGIFLPFAMAGLVSGEYLGAAVCGLGSAVAYANGSVALQALRRSKHGRA